MNNLYKIKCKIIIITIYSEISQARNNSNLEKMKTKNDLVDKLLTETLEKLKEFAKPDNQKYQKLIKDLIIESMVKMLETQCYIQVRKCDSSFVSSILKDCEQEFSKLMKKETDRDYSCKLILDDNSEEASEYGGVRVLSKDKKIILANDLQSRLYLAKEKNLPTIKNMLFPKPQNQKKH